MQAATSSGHPDPVARPRRSDMPPPPPRPSTAVRRVASSHDASAHSSSDSDIDIEETSPSRAEVTAAWIQKQQLCPEPFLSAAEHRRLLIQRRRVTRGPAPSSVQRPNPPAAAMPPNPPAAALPPNPLAAAQQSNSPRAAQASFSPTPPPPVHLPPTGPSSSSASLPAAASPTTEVKTSSRCAVKPPLYPAKKPKTPGAEGSTGVAAAAAPRAQSALDLSAANTGSAAGPGCSNNQDRRQGSSSPAPVATQAAASPSTETLQGTESVWLLLLQSALVCPEGRCVGQAI